MRRFWDKVRKTDGCWLWTAAHNGKGYGVLGFRSKRIYAHRLSYELAFGPIPDGLCVCHRCDVPGCVRPEHLFAATQLENIRDMVSKGRSRPYERHGERNPRAVLRREQVAELRRLRAEGWSLPRLAAHFGIGTSQAWRITHGASWNTEETTNG
jgi:hypothetical protein